MSSFPRCRCWTLLCLGLVVGGVASAAFVAGRWNAVPQRDSNEMSGIAREVLLRAGSATGSKSLSMATGPIDNEVEGLYVLDHTSGNLFCYVPNNRGAGFMAMFQANVRNDFGLVQQGQAPDYVMVTGTADFAGGAGAQGRPANTIVYVGDTNTGKVVGYTFIWSRNRAAAGGLQGGPLVKLGELMARDNSLIRQ